MLNQAAGARKTAGPAPKKQRTWTIRGQCYDLSEWVSRHPGGPLILGQTRGTDCTFLFDSYHLTNLPVKMLEKYRVEEAPTNERASDYASLETKQYDKLKSAVQTHFEKKGISTKAPPLMQLYYCLWAMLHFGAIYQVFYTGSMLSAIVLGCSSFYFSADVLHTGAHYELVNSASFNLNIAYFMGVFHHVPGAWIRQHNLGHHPYTNHPKFDPDCRHFSVPAVMYGAGWRLNEETKSIPCHENWPIWFPTMVSLTGVGPLIFESMLWLVTGKYMGRVISVTSAAEKWLSIFQLCMFLTFYGTVVFSWGIARAMVPVIIHGMLYYGTSQVSHANHGSQQENDVEWCIKQFKSSAGDYSWQSRVTLFMSIGLNLQSVHHIFPSIHWWHYPELYPIICKELGQPLTTKSYAQALWEHLTFLHVLNSPKSNRLEMLRKACRHAERFFTVLWGMYERVVSIFEQNTQFIVYEALGSC
jgi:fatty acid desaturase